MHSIFFQFGRTHVPVFGVFAAIGLMAALALSQKVARYAPLDPDAVWNAGMTAVVSAFLISRALLVIFNWHSFMQYPLLVLALPSLTSVGVSLTCLFMVAYLRWRRLPVLRFLDVMAPCMALLWAFLSAGRSVEGTRDGMTTSLPWGVVDGTMLRVHPVELYTLVSAGALCIVLLRASKQAAVQGRTAGRMAGKGLALAGLAIYFIDFFRLPSNLSANLWIEPAQAIAIAMIVGGAAMMVRREAKIQRATGAASNNRSEGPDAI